MYYVVFALLVGILSIIPWPKLKAALYVGLVIAAPFLYWDTLSRPKHFDDEIRNDEEVAVLGYYVLEGQAVYYLLKLPNLDEPRYYYEPWNEESRKRAEQLQQGAENGSGMVMVNPFEKSLETEDPKTLHELPQPKRMPKPAPPTVQEFEA